MKAIIYAMQNNNEENTAIETQIKAAQRIAENYDISVMAVFADFQTSSVLYPDTKDAKKFAEDDAYSKHQYRIGLGAALDTIVANRIDAIIVERHTRLFRNNKSKSAEYLKAFLDRHRISVLASR